MYVDYIGAVNELNNVAISLDGSSELKKLAVSEERWAKNKLKGRISSVVKVKKGDVHQFDFGKSYVPEMAYEHRGLVIGINKMLLYVLPIVSLKTQNQQHQKAYHPKDNPTGKSDFFLLKGSDFEFIKHDSVLKLNDLRTVSVSRRLYKLGELNTKDTTYSEIESLVLQKYFQQFYFEHLQLKKEVDMLRSDNCSLEKKIQELTLNDYSKTHH